MKSLGILKYCVCARLSHVAHLLTHHHVLFFNTSVLFVCKIKIFFITNSDVILVSALDKQNSRHCGNSI